MGRLRTTVTCEVTEKGLVFHLQAYRHLYMTIIMFVILFCAGGVGQKSLSQVLKPVRLIGCNSFSKETNYDSNKNMYKTIL